MIGAAVDPSINTTVDKRGLLAHRAGLRDVVLEVGSGSQEPYLSNSCRYMQELWEENLCRLLPSYEIRYLLGGTVDTRPPGAP